jgi:hypothetical protein
MVGTQTTSASKPPYRQLTKKDMRLWEVAQENFDLLEACPEDYLLRPWRSLLGRDLEDYVVLPFSVLKKRSNLIRFTKGIRSYGMRIE